MVSHRRALLVTVLAALLVATAGCVGGDDGTDPAQPDLDELQANSIEAMEDVETASFEMRMGMEVDGMALEMDTVGEMDLADRRMHMDSRMAMFGQEMEIEQYVVDDTMYMHQDDQWVSEPVPDQEEMWEHGQQVGAQQDALEGADLEYNGTATVHGEEHHVVDVLVTEEVLEDFMQAGGGNADELAGDEYDLSQTRITQYVHPETHVVHRTEMAMEMQIEGETARTTMTVTIDDVNEPVDIELPEEARS